MAGWSVPVAIAPDPVFGLMPCRGLGGLPPGPSATPINFGGKLYLIVSNESVFDAAGVYRSTDNGVTWTGPLDQAGAPGVNNAVMVFDGAHTLNVVYSSSTVDAFLHITLLPVKVRPFDLVTETWGADNGATAGNYLDCSYALQRSDGSIVAFINNATIGSPPLSTYTAGIWKAGVWLAEISLMTNFPSTNEALQNPSGLVDATDTVYAMCNYRDPLSSNAGLICQVIKPNNTLGPFQQILGANGGQYGCIFQNKIILPAPLFIGRASYFVSPLTTPAFVPSGILCDPDPAFSPVTEGISATTDGTNVYIAYNDDNFNVIRVCRSSDAVTWTAETVATATISADADPIVWPSLVPAKLALTFKLQDSGTGSDFSLFATELKSPPPPVPSTNPLIIAGSPYPISACRKRNGADWCLFEEELALRKIVFPPMCNIPEEYRNLLPWDDDFGAIPPQSRTFRPAQGILTPGPAAGDQIVLTLTMPRGYDGLLSGLFQIYTGSGFEQGSGDIIWRIQINQRYVKDLSNSLFSYGSPKFPLPLTQGQILLSGQTIRYIVNVPNLSGNIQVGNSQIVCSLIGFYWPRG